MPPTKGQQEAKAGQTAGFLADDHEGQAHDPVAGGAALSLAVEVRMRHTRTGAARAQEEGSRSP